MSRRALKNVAVIGLGIIGSRVREVLRSKDFHVFVWNRTPRPIPNFVGAPIELAEMCNVIELFVSDDDALLDVTKQLAPGLGARHIVIAHSTVAPHSMIAAGEIVQRRGARFLEAPFTGSKEAAAKGQLVYYVGGDETALRDVRPILEATSKEILYIGALGQATTIKITTNMVTAASIQAVAEALALTQSAGLPAEKFVAAMKGNASNSKTIDLKLPKIVSRDYEPHFSVKHMLKDMQIASRMGLTHQLELAVTSAARDRLLEQMQRGFGDEDYSAIARKYFGARSAPTEGTPKTEAGLELFEPRQGPAQPEWIDLNAGMPAPANPVPLPPPAPAPQDVAMPEAQEVAPLIAPAESQPPMESAAGSVAAIEEVFEEPVEQRRGFFGRLLRREGSG
jgi:3-hydroxyisobutyrate dehydrogenase-like beta-hydroxyacid dehydrogenase